MALVRTLLIANLGRAAGRVIHNIIELSPPPTEIIIFRQKDPGWNPETNKEYAEVIKWFKTHREIQKYIKNGKLRECPISSISNYSVLFDTFADLIEENKDYFDIIYIDCSGLPKIATIVVTQLAGIYPNVVPIYNRPKSTSIYEKERDAQLTADEGWGPEQLPFHKIDIGWVHNPNKFAYKVLRAAYLFTKGNIDTKFNDKDLIKILKNIGRYSARGFGVGKKKLLDTGIFVRDLTHPNYYRLTLLGVAIARRFITHNISQ